MSVEGIFNQEHEMMAKKLMDAVIMRQEAGVGNIANQHTDGYKRMKVGDDFYADFQKMLDDGDYEGIEGLEANLEVDRKARVGANGNSVEVETELMEMNKNELEFKYYAQFLSDSYRRIEMAIITK